ncbi:MAG: class I SAM-dependent methyltransferase, partial [Fimbriimonadaceae bacterium]|nr:class I SAM-dependent methyltransferase [Alphaproteobacteria bacterium]
MIKLPSDQPQPRFLSRPENADLAEIVAQSFIDQGFCGPVSQVPPMDVAWDMLSDERIATQFRELERHVDLTGKRILEIGSGWGCFVALGRKWRNYDVWGVEPAENEFGTAMKVSHEILRRLDIPQDVVVPGYGENLLFPSESFDVVCSYNVLEHVSDPEAVVDEALRVLKPGGTLHFVVPNFGSWWEGHYGIPWLPNMRPGLAKAYVRLLGRDPAYIDTLRLINRRFLKRVVTKHGKSVQVLGWGEDVFAYRLRTLDFGEWAGLSIVKSWARILKRTGLVNLFIRISVWFRWETPI